MFKLMASGLLGASLLTSSAYSALREKPQAISGLYSLAADDTDAHGYNTQKDWTPGLYDYQQKGFNTLFLTFVRPDTMEVPKSFINLGRTRGKPLRGAVPANTKLIYAVGGMAYSTSVNPWPWLTSAGAAREMARKVASWQDLYGADGIDLDIEDGAGNAAGAGENLIVFVKELKRIKPSMLVTLPVYGYPQINATNALVNAAFSPDGRDYGLVDAVGIMVYEGTDALNYAGNYAKIPGKGRWEGFPITAGVPKNKVVLGLKGTASNSDIQNMAREIQGQGFGGFMVWYGSFHDQGNTALQYPPSWDSSTVQSEQWSAARQSLGDYNGGHVPVQPIEGEDRPPVQPEQPQQPEQPIYHPPLDNGSLQCSGAGDYKSLPNIAQWCTDNCKVGNCPPTHCACH